MIEVIPAIDIIGGRCVRLSQGDYGSTRVYGDPLDMAKAFAGAGARRIHLVDLDGAKASAPVNLSILEKIASVDGLAAEWGGGIKTDAALSDVFSAGACWAVIGSVAALNPGRFIAWLGKYGPGRIVLGADVKEGVVAVNGWLEGSSLSLEDLLRKFEGTGLSQVICTDISRDGMLCGPSSEFYSDLAAAFPGIGFTVSGGVSCEADITRMDVLGLPRIIVGKAYYEGRITLEQLEKWWRNA